VFETASSTVGIPGPAAANGTGTAGVCRGRILAR
jgi:hypothetical protein